MDSNLKLLKLVDEFIFENIKTQGLIHEMAQYHFSTGGKRLRSLIVLRESEFFQLDIKKTLPWAAAVELLHNSTLVHDDIQDNDELRRGMDTVWAKYGVPQAINLGNWLIFKSFEIIAENYNTEMAQKLVAILAKTSQEIVLGQSNEFEIDKKKPNNFWSEYESIALLKTGALIKACVEGVHVLLGINPPIETWKNMGLAYQIEDDINDFFGLKQDKQKQKDFHEKKVNALIAWLSRDQKNISCIQNYLRGDGVEVIYRLLDQSSTIEALMNYKNKLVQEFDQEIKSTAKFILLDKSKKDNDRQRELHYAAN